MGHRAERVADVYSRNTDCPARKTGRAELDERYAGVNVSEIEAPFELKDRSRQELVADVRARVIYHYRCEYRNRPTYQPPYRCHAFGYQGQHCHQTVLVMVEQDVLPSVIR